jgi:predicted acyl esterase
MKKTIFLLFLLLSGLEFIYAQDDIITAYIKKTYMIPMRDGIKLFTVVLSPKDCNRKVPVLMQRTPYGADFPLEEDSALNVKGLGSLRSMAEGGYIQK